MGSGTFSHQALGHYGLYKSLFYSNLCLHCKVQETLLRLLLPGLKTKRHFLSGLCKELKWTQGQRCHIMCLLIWLFKGAPVQHCASWFLNVDFATICRTIVYYCCSCSLDFFIWCIICKEKNKSEFAIAFL